MQHFKIHKSKKNNEMWFTVKGKNGKTIVTSETYKRISGVKKGINAVIDAACETSLTTKHEVEKMLSEIEMHD